MRFLLYLLWLVISVLVVVLVSMTLLLTVFHEQIEEKLVAGIEHVTDRNVEIAGGFGFKFNPLPTFVIRDIRMANADWGSRPWMLEIEALQASVKLGGLFRGQVHLANVKGTRPRVLVEKDVHSGAINWIFEPKRVPRPFPWPADNLKLATAFIEGATVEIDVGPIKHVLELDAVAGDSDYFSGLANIHALGQLDRQPLEMSIQLETLRTMFLREPTHLKFEGLHGATEIHGQGYIRDLLRWRGHDIQLRLAVPTLKGVQGWVQTHLIDTPRLRAAARFVQPETWATARFESIEVSSDALDGETLITGRVEQLRGMNGIDLQGQFNYPLASIMRWKSLQSTTDTLLDARVSLKGDRDHALAFQVYEASLIGDGVDVRGAGSVSHLLAANTEGISFTGQMDSLAKAGRINAKNWFETEAVSGRFELAKQEGRLSLQNIDLGLFEGRAHLAGELKDITAGQLGDFEVQANLLAEDVSTVNRLNAGKLPVFEQTDISGYIDMARSDFSARGVSLELQSKGLKFTGKGEIKDLKILHLEDAALRLEADSITHINTQFEIELPELGEINAQGKVYGDLNSYYNINVLEAELKSVYQSINAAGRLQQLGPDMTARLELETSIRSAINIPPMFESDLKVPDELLGSGQAILTADGVKNWSLTDIDLHFEGRNQGAITGSIVNFPVAPDFALIANFDRFDAADLPEHDMISTLKPENLRVYGRFTRKPGVDHFSLDSMDAYFSLASGEAAVNIVGSIEDINRFEGLSLLLGLNTPDIHEVPYFASLPLKKDLSGIASIELSGKPELLGITLLSARIQDTDMQGDLVLTQGQGTKPMLEGRLESKNLDIHGLLHQEERKQLFSGELLEFDWLNDLNASLDIQAEHLNGVVSRVNNSRIKLTIKDGILNMPNMTGTVGEGRIAAWFTLVATSKPYSIITSLKAERVKPEHLNLFSESGLVQGGLVDIDVGLGGSGISIADYMGHAYGKIQLQVTDSSLKQRNLELFGADLISGVLDIVDIFQNTEQLLPTECGVFHFPVINGQAIASQGIAIKTEDITILGGGIIDLGTEEIELIIQPKARKGLGINAGTVANIVKISGHIDEPKMVVSKEGLVQSSATIGVAVVSGGWSLLIQGLLDRNKANSDVCQETRESPNESFFQRSDSPKTSFNEIQSER